MWKIIQKYASLDWFFVNLQNPLLIFTRTSFIGLAPVFKPMSTLGGQFCPPLPLQADQINKMWKNLQNHFEWFFSDFRPRNDFFRNRAIKVFGIFFIGVSRRKSPLARFQRTTTKVKAGKVKAEGCFDGSVSGRSFRLAVVHQRAVEEKKR